MSHLLVEIKRIQDQLTPNLDQQRTLENASNKHMTTLGWDKFLVSDE